MHARATLPRRDGPSVASASAIVTSFSARIAEHAELRRCVDPGVDQLAVLLRIVAVAGRVVEVVERVHDEDRQQRDERCASRDREGGCAVTAISERLIASSAPSPRRSR